MALKNDGADPSSNKSGQEKATDSATNVFTNKADDNSSNLLPTNKTDDIADHEHRQFVDDTMRELMAEAQLQEQVLDVKEQTPLIKWQKERVENIKRENIKQVIANLANFDDNQFAMTALGEDFGPGDPRSEAFRIVHMSRVGRLMAEGKNDTDLVVPLLKESLLQSLKDWPDAREERRLKWLHSKHGTLMHEEPDNFHKVTAKAIVGTYVLAELQDFDSLALLVNSYKQTEKWIAEHKPYPVFQFPVPPNITLYAMHRLVANYPEDKLSPDAINARDEYIKWSDQNLPEPKIISRSAWHAEYDTSDPMVKITDPKGILHKEQQKIKLTLYPHMYKDRTRFQGYIEDKVDEKTQEWFDTMEPFLKAVVTTNPAPESDSK